MSNPLIKIEDHLSSDNSFIILKRSTISYNSVTCQETVAAMNIPNVGIILQTASIFNVIGGTNNSSSSEALIFIPDVQFVAGMEVDSEGTKKDVYSIQKISK